MCKLRDGHDVLRRAVRPATYLAVIAGLCLGLAACIHPLPGAQGLKDCFEDLPLAEGALNAPEHSFAFEGAKLVSPRVMARLVQQRFPHNPGSNYKPPKTGSEVCAFAFRGNFSAGQVAGAPPKVSGKAAIVLATTDRQLLFAFVLTKLPENFSQSFMRP